MNKQESTRYAIFYLPEEKSKLWKLGSAWLGYDSILIDHVKQPEYPSLSEHTGRPAKYGFHITVKAPFYLKKEYQEQQLIDQFKDYTAKQKSFDCAGLMIDDKGDFIALRPVSSQQANHHSLDPLHILAERMVTFFDEYRAPMKPSDRATRIKGLNQDKIELLDNWGYPHIFQFYKPHFTLSENINESQKKLILPSAIEYFADELNKPLPISSLCLLKQVNNGNFFVLERQALGA